MVLCQEVEVRVWYMSEYKGLPMVTELSGDHIAWPPLIISIADFRSLPIVYIPSSRISYSRVVEKKSYSLRPDSIEIPIWDFALRLLRIPQLYHLTISYTKIFFYFYLIIIIFLNILSWRIYYWVRTLRWLLAKIYMRLRQESYTYNYDNTRRLYIHERESHPTPRLVS